MRQNRCATKETPSKMKNFTQKFILLLALVFVISFDTNAQVSGCLDSNATNYDSTATEQSIDPWGSISCVYESCIDVAIVGCLFLESFAQYSSGFSPTECEQFGGTPCAGISNSELVDIPDPGLLNYLLTEFPYVIENDSLNIVNAQSINQINIQYEDNYEIYTLE